jgi:hypothetical protein
MINHYKQIEALKTSINKWKSIVAKTGTDRGMDNCACCHLNVIGIYNDCSRCLIYKYATIIYPNNNNDCCGFNEYRDWVKNTSHQRFNVKVITDNDLKCATKVLNFLQKALILAEK